ncbi:hypothetical protein B7494_g8005 [Chlorociboria aeruginascens]|nr:hypothetical protein B7494_g8005 [Chlorociboria aeruginascens]
MSRRSHRRQSYGGRCRWQDDTNKSARDGCKWCAIFLEAVKRIFGAQEWNTDDCIYWRYKGESFFEPCCIVRGTIAAGNDFKIQIYTTHPENSNDGAPQLPVKNDLNRPTSSEATMKQIDRQRQQCYLHQSKCPSIPSIVLLPCRCLDISDPTNVRVATTRGQQGHYMYLSHRWGLEEMPLRLTSDTLERLEEDDKNDWEVEVAQMASIYRNGLLTISAAASTGPTDGLFNTATPEFADDQPLKFSGHSIPYPVYVRRQPHFDVGHLIGSQAHWLQDRAWVLQERLLSPRVMYFGTNEVAWECMSCTACECEPDLNPYRVTQYSPREPFNPKAAFSLSTAAVPQSPGLWHHIVNAYTGLELTFPEDKFPALAGLQSTFMVDLLWRKRVKGDWNASAWNEHYDLHNVFGRWNDGQKKFERKVRNHEWDELLIDIHRNGLDEIIILSKKAKEFYGLMDSTAGSYLDKRVMDAYGSDALRICVINSPVRAEPLRFKESGVEGVVARVLLRPREENVLD